MATTRPTDWSPTPDEVQRLVSVAGRIAKGGGNPTELLEKFFPLSSEVVYRRSVKALTRYPRTELCELAEIDERFGDFLASVAGARTLDDLDGPALSKALAALPQFVSLCRAMRVALRSPAFTAAIDALVLRVYRGAAEEREVEALKTLSSRVVPPPTALARGESFATGTAFLEVLAPYLEQRLRRALEAIRGLRTIAQRRERLLATPLPVIPRAQSSRSRNVEAAEALPDAEDVDRILKAMQGARNGRAGRVALDDLVLAWIRSHHDIRTPAEPQSRALASGKAFKHSATRREVGRRKKAMQRKATAERKRAAAEAERAAKADAARRAREAAQAHAARPIEERFKEQFDRRYGPRR